MVDQDLSVYTGIHFLGTGNRIAMLEHVAMVISSGNFMSAVRVSEHVLFIPVNWLK